MADPDPKPRRGVRVALAALALAFLLASFWFGHAVRQDDRMYAPVYRWRQAALVALSREARPPARLYEIHRSLLKYFTANGMAILGDEYDGPVKARPDWLYLLGDGPRIDHLLQGAAEVRVDPSLPPDAMRGNEIGYADFFWLAFRLFGTRVSSLYFLYFALLTASVCAFIIAHRDFTGRLFLLCIYLAAHFYSMQYTAQTIDLYTIHNSRTFSAIAMLPGLHLALSFLGPPARRPAWQTAGDVVQVLVLAFLVHCRIETLWVALLVVFSFLLALASRKRRLLARQRSRSMIAVGVLMLALAGFVLAWPTMVRSPAYKRETGRHVFWHAIYTGLVSAHPKLQELYLKDGDEAYGDNMGYNAVLRRLRARGEVPSGIGFVQNGEIYIDVGKGFGQYERLLRPIVLEMIRNHPREVIEAFYYKAQNQLLFFRNRRVFDLGTYFEALWLAAGASLALLAIPGGVPVPRTEIVALTKVMLLFMTFSLITPALDSTTTAFGTLMTYLMLFLAGVTLLPLGALWIGVLRLWSPTRPSPATSRSAT